MAQIEYLPVVLTGIGLTASIIYYSLVLRNSNKTRQSQLYMQVFDMVFNSREFLDEYNYVTFYTKWDTYEEFDELSGMSRLEETEFMSYFGHVISVYEGVGVMVKSGMLDIGIIALMMSGMTRTLWEKIEPIVNIHRERFNFPRWLSEFEYLYTELMEYHKKHPELAT